MYIENVTESRDGGDGRKEREREIKYEVTKAEVLSVQVFVHAIYLIKIYAYKIF